MEWKLAGANTGSSSVSLPSVFSELYILVLFEASTCYAGYEFLVPEFAIDSNYTDLHSGFADNTNTNRGLCVLRVTKTAANIQILTNSAGSVISNATLKVYYR